MRREEYGDVETWSNERRLAAEEDWPEFSESVDLVNHLGYITNDMEAKAWREHYLKQHVQRIQEMKQNHVHVLNAQGESLPLTHCQRADDPKKCKGDFPRTRWLIDKAVILCQGLMYKMGMPMGGRRNKLGSLHGPRNEDHFREEKRYVKHQILND